MAIWDWFNDDDDENSAEDTGSLWDKFNAPVQKDSAGHKFDFSSPGGLFSAASQAQRNHDNGRDDLNHGDWFDQMAEREALVNNDSSFKIFGHK